MSGGHSASVEFVDRWVYKDLSEGRFTDADQREILNDLDELEDQLVTWERPLRKCVKMLTTAGDHTIYRRRQGDARSYLIRDGNTLYCIGIGKRDTTYERDLDQIAERAASHQEE
jgi:mRNA-degrading endonuclease RelE of RelBE toxin-antitoxin system